MEAITRQQAAVRGLNGYDLAKLVAGGQWTRLRRNWYLPRRTDSDEDLHRQLLDTYLSDFGDHAVASYGSAAVLHGLSRHQIDLSVVHLSRTGDGRARRSGTVHLHAALRGLAPVGRVEHPATTVVQLARGGLESGLVAADCALRRELTTRAELLTATHAIAGAPGRFIARQVVEVADGRHESPGETLAALRLREVCIAVEPQFAVPGTEKWTYSGEGYRTDFRVRGTRVVIEFDGKSKYGRGDDIWKEKLREDRIRELGWQPVRIIWAELFNGQAAAKVRAALARAA